MPRHGGLGLQRMGPLRIAVNVSPRQLQHDDLVGQVERVLAETGLAGRAAGAGAHRDGAAARGRSDRGDHRRLRALGIGLALDDFGTGYSSLSHLRQYPIQRLKMDPRAGSPATAATPPWRGDHRASPASSGSRWARGVETAEQLALLGSFGCEEAQGFYLGRPMPAHDVAGALRIAA